MEVEETKESPFIGNFLNNATNAMRIVAEKEQSPGCNTQSSNLHRLTDFSTTAVHELYCQPEEIMDAVFELSKVSGLHEVAIYELLSACSMDVDCL